MQHQPTLDHRDADIAIPTILADLTKRNAFGFVAVADKHGELTALVRMT